MEPKVYEVLILSNEMKRIKIHCRCGQEGTYEIPAFLETSKEVQTVIRCSGCGQPYATARGNIVRLNRETGFPEKLIEKGQTVDKVEEKLRAEGKFISPGSNVVN